MSKPGEFTKKVWELALQIPPGKVVTYGQLAVAAGGHPMMAQMITHLLSKSPDADKIPWHRIVYADGRVWLSPDCDQLRRRLYQQEGIELDSNNRIVDFDSKVYLFK